VKQKAKGGQAAGKTRDLEKRQKKTLELVKLEKTAW
tara:strand:- start:761 stop:868 length:108 start_codon:yes stop_codon:yes gene_type:complete